MLQGTVHIIRCTVHATAVVLTSYCLRMTTWCCDTYNSRQWRTALKLMEDMSHRNITPNDYTFAALIRALSSGE
jgi:pentatricopeptide repeat protein